MLAAISNLVAESDEDTVMRESHVRLLAEAVELAIQAEIEGITRSDKEVDPYRTVYDQAAGRIKMRFAALLKEPTSWWQ